MMNVSRICHAIAPFCVVFGLCAPIFYCAGIYDEKFKKENAEQRHWHGKFEYEVWTDEKTGYRFLIAARKSNIGGIGVFLIPQREEENDVPEPALADKVILESTIRWKEVQ